MKQKLLHYIYKTLQVNSEMPRPIPRWSHRPHRKAPVHTKSVSITKCLIGNVSALETCIWNSRLVENNLSEHPHFPVHAVQPLPGQPGHSKSTQNALQTKKGRPNKTYIHITLPVHKHKQVYLHKHKHTNNPYFCLW